MTFNAEAGRPYRLWFRGIAANNSWTNDSVFAQFTNSVNSSGAAIYRIGTRQAAGESRGLFRLRPSGWGWQDNGWGVERAGPGDLFCEVGPQTIRIQNSEDGFSIDQIVLSPSAYLTMSPGAEEGYDDPPGNHSLTPNSGRAHRLFDLSLRALLS